MLTDVHTHLVAPRYLDYLRSQAAQAAVAASLPWLEDVKYGSDALLREMDAAGVDASWVSFPPPGVVEDSEQDALRHALELNELLAEQLDRYRDRLKAVPLLPVPHPHACEEVLAQVGTEIPAVIVYVQVSGPQLEAASFRPVLRGVANLGVPLLIHPGVEPIGPMLRGWGLGSALSAPVATTAAVVRLIASGTLDDVEHLEMILCHLGGVLPLVLKRLEDQLRSEAAHDIRHYLRRRIRFDSAVFDMDALRYGASVFGADRIVLGSDAPFRDGIQRAAELFREVR